LEDLITYSLKENSSMIGFDARFNPGASSKVLKKIALCMLKNMSIMQKKKQTIKNEWIKEHIINHPEIP
jgi:hypothetical protein